MADPSLNALADALSGLAPVTLAAARLAPVVWLAPTFGGRLLPAPARAGLVLVLAFLLAGGAPGQALSVAAVAREAALGLALGLLSALPFEAARAGGQLVDTVRGASIAEVLVPTSKERAGPVGDLLQLTLLGIVAGLCADRLLLRSLGEVFAALPPGAPWLDGAESLLARRLLHATAALLACAVSLAAPAVVACVLVDLLLGVVGRVAPQLPLFFLGLPAKGTLGLAAVGLGLGVLLDRSLGELSSAAQALVGAAAALAEAAP